MVRIYKDPDSLQVIIEGVSPEFPSLLSYTISDGRVTVTSKSKNKITFDDKWQNIRDHDNNSFDNATDLINYLEEIFDPTKLVDKKDLDGLDNGLDFLAYYTLAKN